MRSVLAAAALLTVGVVLFGDSSRSMYAVATRIPATAPSQVSGRPFTGRLQMDAATSGVPLAFARPQPALVGQSSLDVGGANAPDAAAGGRARLGEPCRVAILLVSGVMLAGAVAHVLKTHGKVSADPDVASAATATNIAALAVQGRMAPSPVIRHPLGKGLHAGRADSGVRRAGRVVSVATTATRRTCSFSMSIDDDAEYRQLSDLTDPAEMRDLRDAAPGLLPHRGRVVPSGDVAQGVSRDEQSGFLRRGKDASLRPPRDPRLDARKRGRRRRNSSRDSVRDAVKRWSDAPRVADKVSDDSEEDARSAVEDMLARRVKADAFAASVPPSLLDEAMQALSDAEAAEAEAAAAAARAAELRAVAAKALADAEAVAASAQLSQAMAAWSTAQEEMQQEDEETRQAQRGPEGFFFESGGNESQK
jgi:hypothetical protein